MASPADSNAFKCSGRTFPASEIALIREVVASCGGLSRKELANTISELMGWTRANGLLKRERERRRRQFRNFYGAGLEPGVNCGATKLCPNGTTTLSSRNCKLVLA